MKTLKLTTKDFKEVNGYKEYIGKEDLTELDYIYDETIAKLDKEYFKK